MDNSDTLGVLQQLERGEISSAEADARLNAPPQVERIEEPPLTFEGAPNWIRKLWIYPVISGLVGVAIGTWIIIATVHANVLWFLCGLPIVLLSSIILALGASATAGHWLYVNVQSSRKRKHTVRFAIPFPLGLARGALWIAKFFGRHPKAKMTFRSRKQDFNLDWADLDAFFDGLERELREHRGVTVEVNDNDERVQVYIV
ncbi:MAG: hypothetical protein HZC40_15925 [Chloroflexi bacterium]|nr:hypothetical protein [Chloroflexota bacterium]